MKKSVLSFLLALSILCSIMLPGVLEAKACEACLVETSGMCGDTLFWTFYPGRGLEIDGWGPMWDGGKEYYGWLYTYSIIIYGGSYIGACAFYEYSHSSIYLYAPTVEIGEYAFAGTGFATEELPNELQIIGKGAFQNCSSIKNVIMPASLVTIKSDAFSNCKSLRSVKLKDVKSWCEVELENPASNPLSIANMLYVNDELTTELVIPEGTKRINDYAFYNCTSIKSVTIPKSVEYIGKEAFHGCSALKEVHFSDHVDYIDPKAFDGSFADNNPEDKWVNGLLWEGDVLIEADPSLKGSVVIPDGIRVIAPEAFRGCCDMEEVLVPDTVEEIGDYAFADCVKLQKVTLPKKSIRIGEGVFDNTTVIKNPDSEKGGLIYVDQHLVSLASKDQKAYYVEEGTYTVAKNLFSSTAAKVLVLPESVQLVNTGAFGSLKEQGLISVLTMNPDCEFYRKGTLSQREINVYGVGGGKAERSALDCNYQFVPICDCDKDAAKYSYVYDEASCAALSITCESCHTTKAYDVSPEDHEYDSGKVTKENTCTTDGICTYTCAACGYEKQEIIPAEHVGKDSYENLGPKHKYTLCDVCGQYEMQNHDFENGPCICGAQVPEETNEIVMRHSLDLSDNLAINYVISEEQLKGFSTETMYILCRENVYKNNAVVDTKKTILYPTYRNGNYYFTYEDLNAAGIGNELTATFYGEKVQKLYQSAPDTYSAATYAYSQLSKSNASDKLKRLCADLIQYGTWAQKYTGYRMDALADKNMTEEYKAYYSNLNDVSFGNVNYTLTNHAAPSVSWVGKALNLTSSVGVKYVIDTSKFEGELSELKLHVVYYTPDGKEHSADITKMERYGTGRNTYAFTCNELKAADLRTMLFAQVYCGEEPVSCTLLYSPDSYGNGKTGKLLSLCQALFAYVDSAKAYFTSK